MEGTFEEHTEVEGPVRRSGNGKRKGQPKEHVGGTLGGRTHSRALRGARKRFHHRKKTACPTGAI